MDEKLQAKYYTGLSYLSLLFYIAFVIDGFQSKYMFASFSNAGPMLVFFGTGLLFLMARSSSTTRANMIGFWIYIVATVVSLFAIFSSLFHLFYF